jgi:2-keto-4-pentenoate hydratase/2-oxohepta-3-ene-1,7-dioic acid hydratase in catechol pathway
MDWEIELAAVIGHTAKDVALEQALDHVAGYTIANDLSARDMGRRPNVPDTSPFKFDWVAHKNFDGSCPLGPWIVPASDIPDPRKLGLKLWVTLNPGDVILTGTPSGVGAARQEFLGAGDVVRLWIEHIGTLTNRMA